MVTPQKSQDAHWTKTFRSTEPGSPERRQVFGEFWQEMHGRILSGAARKSQLALDDVIFVEAEGKALRELWEEIKVREVKDSDNFSALWATILRRRLLDGLRRLKTHRKWEAEDSAQIKDKMLVQAGIDPHRVLENAEKRELLKRILERTAMPDCRKIFWYKFWPDAVEEAESTVPVSDQSGNLAIARKLGYAGTDEAATKKFDNRFRRCKYKLVQFLLESTHHQFLIDYLIRDIRFVDLLDRYDYSLSWIVGFLRELKRLPGDENSKWIHTEFHRAEADSPRKLIASCKWTGEKAMAFIQEIESRQSTVLFDFLRFLVWLAEETDRQELFNFLAKSSSWWRVPMKYEEFFGVTPEELYELESNAEAKVPASRGEGKEEEYKLEIIRKVNYLFGRLLT